MTDLTGQLFAETSLNNADRPTMGYETNTDSDRGDIRAFNIKNASIGSAQIGTAAIGSANIRNFNFNQGTGGTLTLGGTANGNGMMHVLNSSGGTVVTVDNSGIAVTNGNISIQDTNGTTILDSTGLVSAANFANNIVNDSNDFSTNSSSFVDVTNMSLTFTLARTANVFMAGNVIGYNPSTDGVSGYNMNTIMDISGTQMGAQMNTPGIYFSGGGVIFSSASSFHIQTLVAGTYTLKLRTKQSVGGSARFPAGNAKTLLYVVLGK